MTKPAEIAKMVTDAEAQMGSVDILINNAGIQFVAPIEDFPAEKWDAIIAINLSAAFHSIKAALPGMKKRGYGRIINISSVHGLVASANKVAYVSAKHGIIGMTKTVALENAATPVTCNAICPGWVHTPLVQKQIEDIAKRDNISIQAATEKLLSEKEPSKRFTYAEDIAAMVLFLCGDHASNVTGSAYTLDGGWTAQ
jgi:3-hydroxybutyrate dehydrogenase